MTPALQPSQIIPKCIPPAIDNGSLIFQDMLGVGAYGSVYRALDTHSGQMRAVKCLINPAHNSRQRAFQALEAQLHALVSGHPNIATLHRVIEDEDFLYMVLDCGVEGDLFSKITERGGYVGNDAAIKTIFAQIASAVMHCHSQGVFHRDLKPENVIIVGDEVKLVDFGLATAERISTEFGCGSTFYLSPECQGGYLEPVKSYDSAANDVWSMAVILINLVFGRNPWKQACVRDETFAAYVRNTDFLRTILPMSNELNEIVKAAFCLNPRERISLQELANRVQLCKSFTTHGLPARDLAAPTTVEATAQAAKTAAATAVQIGSYFVPEEKRQAGNEKDQSQDSGVDLHSMS
ncbi:kinase-like domain-containing protein [Gamsiella multidivaricata]|uniref:kinase-like domain-containing protein n=1 Tax=Gamsiella multidivaricata TaxID=101098 RepID=UPI0022210D63|nr:kinase-like domain-containing protein [Gamsiella multidivaricata]KAG0350952.1 hypothetical protein BGZ54_003503 [Gamsiella multidivaricata]KAI7827126.1 kinase-like domain-containing protein [Gamsiella multidivaricata]